MAIHTRVTRGSITTMGLKNYLNANYPEYGGYDKFVECQRLGFSDGMTGNAFGGLQRQSIRPWRLRYRAEDNNG